MNIEVKWEQKMLFNARIDGHTVAMDAKSPIGNDSAPSPKQLTLAGICGCTGMDVTALLHKYKQKVESFTIEAEAPQTDTHPRMFTSVHLKYIFTGPVEVEKVKAAIHLSMTQYCGVSAMISKAAPIDYEVIINGESVGTGEAAF